MLLFKKEKEKKMESFSPRTAKQDLITVPAFSRNVIFKQSEIS